MFYASNGISVKYLVLPSLSVSLKYLMLQVSYGDIHSSKSYRFSIPPWLQHSSLASAFLLGFSIPPWLQHSSLASAFLLGFSIPPWLQHSSLASAFLLGFRNVRKRLDAVFIFKKLFKKRIKIVIVIVNVTIIVIVNVTIIVIVNVTIIVILKY